MNKLTLIVTCAFLAACSDSSLIITDCEEGETIKPYCGFQNPEDLVLLPDGETLLVSQMGYMEDGLVGHISTGSIVEFNEGGQKRVLFAGGVSAQKQTGWGDTGCPGAPSADFSPHGIDLETRTDGRLQLLVVNHGGRESVEFFEVLTDNGKTNLAWRGCVVMTEGMFLNDVVAMRDGGFWVTHMFPPHSTWALVRSLMGSKLGHVLAWSSDKGVQKIPGSEGAMPNGIEKSADERFAFINMYMENTVNKLEVATGNTVKVAEVSSPDNVVWDRDGKHLLVASHLASLLDSLSCQGLTEGSCGYAFEIVRVDSEALTRETVVAHAGAPMGAATVALPVNEYLYLGTYAGDRIARIAYPE